jgi:hypothetical protein
MKCVYAGPTPFSLHALRILLLLQEELYEDAHLFRVDRELVGDCLAAAGL